jgi:bifunctional non-homologous end joining protein LigD
MVLPPGDWRLEPKLDGWRALATVVDGALTVRTRHSNNVTATLPELKELPVSLADRRVLLDGELVVGGGTADDFYRLGPRLALSARRAGRGPLVTFVAFDVLHLAGVSLVGQEYLARRRDLEQLSLTTGGWQTADSLIGDPAVLLRTCEQLGLEGLVAKRTTGTYRPGKRSLDWRKIKTPSWRLEHHERRRAA